MQHSYSYDSLNRLTADTTGNRTATTWTYDAADELKTSSSASNASST